MQECQNEANGGKFRLRDLLSVPMQRVLKYPLLLRVIFVSNTYFIITGMPFIYFYCFVQYFSRNILQCFDAVGRAAGRASGL